MDHSKKLVLVVGLALFAAFAMTGCEGDQGPQGPAGVTPDAQDLSCTDCHASSNLIGAKVTQWEESNHGMGESYVRGTSSSCAGCHSGNAFVEMVEAGNDPGSVADGDPDPTRQDCYACHQIHQTYTQADYALTTTAAVNYYAVDGETYDGGMGNLCVNCHQPRRVIPDPVAGEISGITSHWGPHHGPQSAMLQGLVGAGDVTGNVSSHYTLLDNTCTDCHMVGADHTFEPDVEACQPCHPGAEDFDIGDTQTEVDALITQLGDRLVAYGLINENTEDGHPIVSSAPENEAIALWNWLYVAHEDKSRGVHNAAYAKALLNKGLELLPPPAGAAK